jgi:outer membrane protein TolC
VRQRLPLDLQQAIALAAQNDPTLQASAARVSEQQGWLRSVQGRFYPVFGLDLGGGYSQLAGGNLAWQGNTDVPGFGPGTPFNVPTGGWNRYQTNSGAGFALLRLDYELVSFERALEARQGRTAAE